MNSSLFVSYLLFCIVMTCTPGPNNILVMLSGARFGILRTFPLVLGIAFGIGIQLVAIGIGMKQIFHVYPQFQFILSLISFIYIIWLAWKIASKRSTKHRVGTKTIYGLCTRCNFSMDQSQSMDYCH